MLISIILSILFLYAIMIMAFGFSWRDKKHSLVKKNKQMITVSIVIAVRNEEQHIKSCLKSLINQTYKNIEIIIIDDHSDDNTVKIINRLNNKDSRIKLFKAPENTYGKKSALKYAVEHTSGQILLFTDGDCILKKDHVKSMIRFFDNESIGMVCGPVEFENRPGLLQKFFQLEFFSLIGSGAAGIFLNLPFMCNGANFAVKKDIYNSAFKHINEKYSSGDDVFLIHHVSKKHKVRFAKSINCIVKTRTPNNSSEFFNQRLRWAGKSKAYRNSTAIGVAMLTFLISICMIAVFTLLIFTEANWIYLILIILSKLLIDMSFLYPILKFHNKLYLLILCPALLIFHPFYIFFTALISLFYKPKWKGRVIKA